MTKVPKPVLLILSLCLAALLVGCGGDSKPATPTRLGSAVAPTLTATPASGSAQTVPPTLTSTAASDSVPPGFYGPDKRTGIPIVDAVISDMMAHDVAALQSLALSSEVACAAHPMGVGSPPKCADSESDRQLIEVLPGVAGERLWVRPGEVAARLQLLTGRGVFLYAVYLATDADWPGAKYGIRFGASLTDIGSPGFIINSEGKIVELLGPAGQVENVIPPGRTFVLPPLARHTSIPSIAAQSLHGAPGSPLFHINL